VVVPYVPAGQLVHDEEPTVEYVPAAQVPVHDAFVNPEVAPYVPAGQLVHDEEPTVEYVPAAQLVHCVLKVLPAVDVVPAGH
jgi:hypothetical protein